MQDRRIGLHLNLKTPSRLPPVLLNSFQKIITHRITAYSEVRPIRDVLQFLPDRLVHSTNRHDNYQVEYLKTLAADRVILKRPDIPNAFPVQLPEFDFAATHIATPQDIQNRLLSLFPSWQAPPSHPRTLLEIDFKEQVSLVLKIFSLIVEYTELGRQGLLSSLNTELDHALDMNALDTLLYKMADRNYIAPNITSDQQNHRYSSYRMTDKGLEAYRTYLNRYPTGPQAS